MSKNLYLTITFLNKLATIYEHYLRATLIVCEARKVKEFEQ